MRIEFNIPDAKLPKLTRKNLVIAGVTLTALIGGLTAYKRYQWDQYVLACDDMRELRTEAKRLMVRSAFDILSHGAEMAVLSSDAGDLFERANDQVRECQRRGA